jgi:UDP-glucose 4-epimerase
VFNICSGEPRSIRSVLAMLLECVGRDIRLEVDPTLVRPLDVPVVYGSFRKANQAFGFHPQRSLQESLRAAWEDAMRTPARCA